MRIVTLLSVLLLLSCSAFGQMSKMARADEYFQAYQFKEAAEEYEKVLKSKPNEVAAMTRLVQSYLRLGKKDKAKHWLNQALRAPLSQPKHYKDLAAMLAMDSRYGEAKMLYEKAAAANDAEGRKWLQAYKNINTFYEDSLIYEKRKVSFNSKFSDFSPIFFGKGLVFCSSRSNAKKRNSLDENFTSFIDLFYVDANGSRPVSFSSQINSEYHEGPLSFNASQDTVYFTRSNEERKSVFSQERVNNLKIFYAVLKKGRWTDIQPLPLNTDKYSVGHPALADSHTLYFVSNKPGGFGGTDLYKSVKVAGEWQTPVNLGPGINTSGNEMFPFIAANGALYFASNGHPGLGGLDIFYADKQKEGWGPVKSMGYPINTPGDDFGLVIKDNAGYYNSNFKSANDDIYAFKVVRNKDLVLWPVDPEGHPLKEVALEIKSANKPEEKVIMGDKPTHFDLAHGVVSHLTFSKPGYVSQELHFNKVDFARYKIQDTVRVVMPFKIDPSVPLQLPVALRDEKGKPVFGGKVVVTQAKTDMKKEYQVDDALAVTIKLTPGERYILQGSRQGYEDGVADLSAYKLETLRGDTLFLQLKTVELFANVKEGGTIDLEIEYDVNKAEIKQGAAQLLDKLVAFLQEQPDKMAELSAHTDSRGSDEYNLALSQRRAEAAVAYIVSKGIEPSRLVAKSYGEQRLKIANAQTEAEHQANRRTTVQILANKKAGVIKASAR